MAEVLSGGLKRVGRCRTTAIEDDAIEDDGLDLTGRRGPTLWGRPRDDHSLDLSAAAHGRLASTMPRWDAQGIPVGT
jgi:hypothetical protein